MTYCGTASEAEPAEVRGELEALLRLPGDEAGWLLAALDASGDETRGGPLPAMADTPEALLPVVSLRCALAAGLAALQQLHSSMTTLGEAFDDVETGMAIFGNGGVREVARNARLEELLTRGARARAAPASWSGGRRREPPRRGMASGRTAGSWSWPAGSTGWSQVASKPGGCSPSPPCSSWWTV